MPRRLTPIALILGLPLLAACQGSLTDLDFDFRNNAISGGGTVETAPPPEPDSRGLITYDSYQIAVAQRGDTVTTVAARLGLDPGELARFNGRTATDPLRDGEVLALPNRVTPGAGGNTDIAAIARGAIDEAEASGPGFATTAPSTPTGQEPIGHRVARGETAYSVARLYGVSVRSLAEWNGLGPDLTVREGQFLMIPIVLDRGAAPDDSAPGTSIAPPPPSASDPLPDRIETAPLPPAQGTEIASAAPEPTAPAVGNDARLIRPVEGAVLRDYSASNEGVDFAAATGTPVRAAADGEVAAITQDTDQIPILVIRHPDGLLTVYANIRNISVSRGDSVSRGQTVAEVGPGDPSFLHFEVRRGFEAVDPNRYLP